MLENNDVQVTSYVLTKWDVPPAAQGQWQLEGRRPGPEGDPHEVRRRIWGKSRPPGREDAEELVRVRNIQQIIKEEMQHVDAIGAVMKGLETLDQKVSSDGDEELGGEQRQVLQTRIVSLKEVEERKEEWREPMLKEMMALAEEKEA